MNSSADQKAAFWHAVQNPEQPHRFSLAVPPEACVGPAQRQFLMGGAAMASAVDALERYFEKPLLWAAIHFLNAGFLDETVDIEVERVSGGAALFRPWRRCGAETRCCSG
ncbi:MAG: hypothetical protein ISN29_06670 [Gammaproteobacteria bacterium AqS3]|nr:hypothetical protein [Gammaproteobacteria bacterium AqS3]